MCACVFSAFLACLFLYLPQWVEHYAALSRLAVRQTLMVNQLVDMEWKFGGRTQLEPDVSSVPRPLRMAAHIHDHRS